MSIENLLEKVSFTHIFFINLVPKYTIVELKNTFFLLAELLAELIQ